MSKEAIVAMIRHSSVKTNTAEAFKTAVSRSK